MVRWVVCLEVNKPNLHNQRNNRLVGARIPSLRWFQHVPAEAKEHHLQRWCSRSGVGSSSKSAWIARPPWNSSWSASWSYGIFWGGHCGSASTRLKRRPQTGDHRWMSLSFGTYQWLFGGTWAIPTTVSFTWWLVWDAKDEYETERDPCPSSSLRCRKEHHKAREVPWVGLS